MISIIYFLFSILLKRNTSNEATAIDCKSRDF